MESSAIISGKSKKDIQLLLALAEKMGIKAKMLTPDEIEDIGMAKAIKEGRTGEYVDVEEFMSTLK